MKNKLTVLLALSLSACNAQNAASPVASGSTSSTASSPAKTLVQANGCSTVKAVGGASIVCADNSSAFVANGSPFRLQDANGNFIGDYLMSVNTQSVWDAKGGAAVTYDINTGQLRTVSVFYESPDCSGQGYIQNAMINTAVQDYSKTMYKVVGPIVSVQYNSVSDPATDQCQTGNPGQLVTSGTANMAQLTTYPNSAMSAQITLPTTVVMATGQ